MVCANTSLEKLENVRKWFVEKLENVRKEGQAPLVLRGSVRARKGKPAQTRQTRRTGRTGQPVGSAGLSRKTGISLTKSTVYLPSPVCRRNPSCPHSGTPLRGVLQRTGRQQAVCDFCPSLPYSKSRRLFPQKPARRSAAAGLSRFFGIIDPDFLKNGSCSLFSRLDTHE